MTQRTSVIGHWRIGAEIPPRDEADRVDHCLAALTESVRELRRRPEGASLHVRKVVFADDCRKPPSIG